MFHEPVPIILHTLLKDRSHGKPGHINSYATKRNALVSLSDDAVMRAMHHLVDVFYSFSCTLFCLFIVIVLGFWAAASQGMINASKAWSQTFLTPLENHVLHVINLLYTLSFLDQFSVCRLNGMMKFLG